MAIRLIQLIILVIPFGIFVWLANIELVPSGVFEIPHDVTDASPYIDALAPQDRVRDETTIIDDPVFFFVHPHRHFDKITFEIWFKNQNVPIVEFGGLVGTKPDVYDLRPFHNLLIDALGWPSVTENGVTLYQKTKRYDSLEDFYKDPPSRGRVATYKADDRAPFRLDGYVPSHQTRTYDVSLRGKHELKTYIKAETLDFRFEYMDMNRDEGVDPITITLFNEQGEPVLDARAQDDGHTRGDNIPSEMKTIELQAQGLKEGVYKVVMNAPRDIIFRKIHTTQQKIVFLSSLFLGDEISYRAEPRITRLWTSSPMLRAQTRHAEGVQTVNVGKETLSIAAPYEWYTIQTPGSLKTIEVPKNDLEILFDGPLALSQESYFEPDPIALRPYVNIEEQGVEYILTTYQPPQKKDGWFVQTIEMDAAPLVFDKKSWKFTFSTPDIKDLGGEVILKEINTTLTRAPLTVWKK